MQMCLRVLYRNRERERESRERERPKVDECVVLAKSVELKTSFCPFF